MISGGARLNILILLPLFPCITVMGSSGLDASISRKFDGKDRRPGIRYIAASEGNCGSR